MSKPTSYHVRPHQFKNAFGFTPCNCHENITTVSRATYRVEYETQPFSSMLKRIEVTCECCGSYESVDVEYRDIDGDSLPF